MITGCSETFSLTLGVLGKVTPIEKIPGGIKYKELMQCKTNDERIKLFESNGVNCLEMFTWLGWKGLLKKEKKKR